MAGIQFRYLTEVAQTIPNLRFVETYVSTMTQQPAALVVRTADTELLGQLQAGLETMKADGTLDEMLARWGLPSPQYRSEIEWSRVIRRGLASGNGRGPSPSARERPRRP